MPNRFLDVYLKPNMTNNKYSKGFEDVLNSLQQTGKVPGTTPVQNPLDIPPGENTDILNQEQPQTDYVTQGLEEMTRQEEIKKEEEQIKKEEEQRNFENKVSGGWTFDPYTLDLFYGGKPQTFKEQDWVKQFIKENDRIPTNQEFSDWSSKQDRTNWEYSPGSHMREMGFKNLGEWLRNQNVPGRSPYGVWSGSEVPEGSTVMTDLKGNPYFRTWRPGEFKGYGQVEAGKKEHYPTYDRVPHIRKAEEILSEPEYQLTVYKAHLRDYLDRLIAGSGTTIENAKEQQQILLAEYNNKYDFINRQYHKDLINSYEAEEQWSDLNKTIGEKMQLLQDTIDNPWTADRKEQQLADAENLVGQNADESQLPFFKESQGVIGQAMTYLMTSVTEAETEKEKKRIRKIPVFEDYPAEKKVPPSAGQEEYDYYNFVNSLNVATPWKTWLGQRFDIFYTQWQKANSGLDFVNWVKDYITRGG